jgi:hypothetical protein
VDRDRRRQVDVDEEPVDRARELLPADAGEGLAQVVDLGAAGAAKGQDPGIEVAGGRRRGR